MQKFIKIIFTVFAVAIASVAYGYSDPELPRIYLDTKYTPNTGRVIYVPSGGDLQAAINSALKGDTIELESGASFIGNFTLPPKNGEGYVVITTKNFAMAEGNRVVPRESFFFAKILSPNVEPAIRTINPASGYRLMGLEVSMTANAVGDANTGGFTQYGLIRLGDHAETVLANQAKDIILDRMYIHGSSFQNLRRCVALNSASTAIINSYISDCHEVGADSQAIAGWNGPGPFKIVNNYLEGAGENVIFGGADSVINNLVPSDIEIRGNTFYKPFTWRQGHATYGGYPWTVKNLFELKTGRRILVEANIFENSWAHAQTGMALNLKSSNQDGTAPWSVTEHVTIRNNVIRNAVIGATIHGKDEYNGPTLVMNNIKLSNNLFDNIKAGPIASGGFGGDYASQGRFIQVTNGPVNVIIDHNTVLQNGITLVVDKVSPGFVFTNNIVNLGEYGIKGDSKAGGNDTINAFFPSSVITHNVFYGQSGVAASYPVNNFFEDTANTIGFVNYNNGDQGDYNLAQASVYNNKASDGIDIGVDFSKLLIYGTVTPPVTPPGTATSFAISSIVAKKISATSFRVSFSTTKPAKGYVEYGLTDNFNLETPVTQQFVTSNVFTLKNLRRNKKYYYKVTAIDEKGNTISSDIKSFNLGSNVLSASKSVK